MAATGPQLNDEQRHTLLTWIAAEYSVKLILHWTRERGWPITEDGIYYHRRQFAADIQQRRTERRSQALTTGLALKDERVERLKQHADALEEIKWVPDEKGKLHNEKAWRETLEQIEIETGQRNAGTDPAATTKVLIEVRVQDV